MTKILKISISWILLISVTVPSGRAEVNGKTAVLKYVDALVKEDGGYGWIDQYDSHLAPTFATLGIMHHLNVMPEDTDRLIDFVNTLHPQRNPDNLEAGPSGTELRNLVYIQVQSLLWMGGDVTEFIEEVEGWETQQGHWANFEKNGYPAFEQEMMTPIVRDLLDMPQDENILDYLKDRKRNNGSYNNTPANDGGDGNILNTWWGIYGRNLIVEDDDPDHATVEWIQSCQLSNGGFTHQPAPAIGINDEIVYTWAAIKTLNLLEAEPGDKEAAIRYLLSLQNVDGGFGNRPGLPSTPMATYYAIDALLSLNALSRLESMQITYEHDFPSETIDYSDYNIYTVQFQAPGRGSIQDALMMADSLDIHLWGAKNADREWIQAAQKAADQRDMALDFFHSNEDYGLHVNVSGMGSFNHIFDPVFPVDRFYESEQWELREFNEFSRESFINDYIEPLLDDNGANLWQVNHNEPLTRLMLDESVNNGGYIAISTIHFNQNFLFWLPHLYQYRYQLPFIALQDFHGSESWWWGNELVHYRNLFLAKEPSYESMMNALRERRIVAVRHDELTGYKTRILGGTPGVREFIESEIEDWKWWDDDTDELIYPWGVISVLQPEDVYEAGKPDSGINIRIRTWWNGPRQTLGEPEVDVIALEINDDVVQPEYVVKENQNGSISDAYYLYSMENPPAGEYKVKTILEKKSSGSRRTASETFQVE